MSKTDLSKNVRHIRALEGAWLIILANGAQSHSKETRREVDEFAKDAGANLRRIKRQLTQKAFVFAPSIGIPLDRGPGKSRRPIVKSPVESRIVQRAIHDSLLRIEPIRKSVENPNSFGGVKSRGEDGRGAVPAAIARTVQEISGGAKYYLRSDIKSFFSHIPKPEVLDLIYKHVIDQESRMLIRDAIYFELENMARLRRQGFDALFPIEDIGVAQGNCLSPLLGNILLGDFDYYMNSGDCACLRYIDDVLIIGSNKKSVKRAFQNAINYLRQYGLTAYDPAHDPDKADEGLVDDGFDFLGVNLKNGLIRPSRKSRRRIIKRICEAFDDSITAMKSRHSEELLPHLSLTGTLGYVNGMARGWAEQYSYCNEKNVFQTLDREIDRHIREYIGKYSAIQRRETNQIVKRKLLGVSLLIESKGKMIEWAQNKEST